MKQFKAPRKSLGGLDADSAAKLIMASADLALILDKRGVVKDVAADDDDLLAQGCLDWIGVPWIDTVTPESRPKIEALLRDANADTMPKARQVNHPLSTRGGDLPIRYSALRIGTDGRIVAVGRDLSATAVLQQRLMDAQQILEREYSRLRQIETQYRALFQLSSEAVMVVDAASMKIIEANPKAIRVLQNGGRRLIGRGMLELFADPAVPMVQSHLASARASPRAEDITVKLVDGERDVTLSASMFRQDQQSVFLVRLTTEHPVGGDAHTSGSASTSIADVVARMPDAFVVLDEDRRVLAVNGAFLELTELAAEEQVKGQPVDRWLGRVAVDVDVLMANLREHGSVRRFVTMVRGEYGASGDVEISAVSVPTASGPCYGLTLRKVERLETKQPKGARSLPRSVEQMTELVGRVPLKDLVRETTDIIERLCIEAALELTGDNRASAAEILGLSRQSLYVKLRRYGLGDLDDERYS